MTERTGNRLQQFITAATRLFIAKGYRRTRMDDVTRAMGLSPAAIYRYVESKEALFDFVVRAAASPEVSLQKIKLPVASPKRGATLRFLRQTLQSEGRLLSLERAVPQATAADLSVELESIVRELYAKTSRYHVGIKLLDRCALDWPELAALWSVHHRGNIVNKLATYLEMRMAQGLIRPVPSTTAWARLMVEITAFLGMHRHFDPHPTPMDDNVAEETAVSAVVHALVIRRDQNILVR